MHWKQETIFQLNLKKCLWTLTLHHQTKVINYWKKWAGKKVQDLGKISKVSKKHHSPKLTKYNQTHTDTKQQDELNQLVEVGSDGRVGLGKDRVDMKFADQATKERIILEIEKQMSHADHEKAEVSQFSLVLSFSLFFLSF